MGYRGKLELRQRARVLRADGMTMPEIASLLGVSRSSVSLWTRDVVIERPRGRRRPANARPSRLALEKQAEIDALVAEGAHRIGVLSERDLLIAGTALYAGEGAKRDGFIDFANSDPQLVRLFCTWLRQFFRPDEQRLRVRLYLHEGLDLEAATEYWSTVTGIPPSQFSKAYRAKADPTIRHNKHQHGCAHVRYSCSTTHRRIMGLIGALLSSSDAPFRGSSIGRAPDC